MIQLNTFRNLVVCQKSKIQDWIDHFCMYYDVLVLNLTKPHELELFIAAESGTQNIIGVINYDLIFRRPELGAITDFTLMLDESSLIQNDGAERTKFIMNMHPKNVILLSGTPTGGKYENLLTQLHLLGWNISENTFWNQYVDWEWSETQDGYWMKKVNGYKNVDRLKRKMRDHGCQFLKTEEVLDLPEQIHQTIKISVSKEYQKFKKNDYIEIEDNELIGDTILKQMLYERQLCGQYCDDKLNAFEDLLDSTEDRLIVFYNFTAELDALKRLCEAHIRPYSLVNGSDKDLSAYEDKINSVTFIQYMAGSMGLNLQLANKIIYFTPPLSSELFEQSKKRIHRIGQNKTCFYYYLVCKGSIEEKIYQTLAMRKDYTEALFESEV